MKKQTKERIKLILEISIAIGTSILFGLGKFDLFTGLVSATILEILILAGLGVIKTK